MRIRTSFFFPLFENFMTLFFFAALFIRSCAVITAVSTRVNRSILGAELNFACSATWRGLRVTCPVAMIKRSIRPLWSPSWLQHTISQLDRDAVDNLLCGKRETLRRNFVSNSNYYCFPLIPFPVRLLF